MNNQTLATKGIDTNRIAHIDAWRFIAVMMVIVGHTIFFSNYSYIVENFKFLIVLSEVGYIGVLIFFCISGFVICRGLIEEQSRRSKVSLFAFYKRRIFRILPPLYLFLIIIFFLHNAEIIQTTIPQVIKAGLFMCNLHMSGGCSWYVGHTWSLAYEEQFYIIFPLLFLILSLRSNSAFKLLFVFICIMCT